MDVEEAVDRLYSLPLQEFVEQRDDLVARLKGDDRDAARRVKSLSKPSVGAWALNQTARKRPDGVRSLVELRDRMEGASAAALRALMQERRDVVGELIAEARSVLEAAGHPASATTIDRITKVLLAAGGSERDALLSGRLTREPESTGLEALELPASLDDAEPAVPDVRARSKEHARLAKDAQSAARTAARLESEARRLRDEADRAIAAAEKAETAARDARRDAESARDRAAEAAAPTAPER